MYCSNCGKEISENSLFCSECGATLSGGKTEPFNSAVNSGISSGEPSFKIAPYNTLSIIGLIISCISIFLNFWGLVGIAGTIVSVLGLQGCNKKNENGKALAVIGIVLGVLSIFYGVFMILILS